MLVGARLSHGEARALVACIVFIELESIDARHALGQERRTGFSATRLGVTVLTNRDAGRKAHEEIRHATVLYMNLCGEVSSVDPMRDRELLVEMNRKCRRLQQAFRCEDEGWSTEGDIKPRDSTRKRYSLYKDSPQG